MVDQDFEEWRTHQAYMVEGARAAEMIYKSIRPANKDEQGARKWIQQKEEGCKIIID